jgi:hypothetical protein
MTACDEGPVLCGTHALGHEEDGQDSQGQRPDEHDAQAGHRSREAGTAPTVRPSDTDQRDSRRGDRDGRQVDVPGP